MKWFLRTVCTHIRHFFFVSSFCLHLFIRFYYTSCQRDAKLIERVSCLHMWSNSFDVPDAIDAIENSSIASDRQPAFKLTPNGDNNRCELSIYTA